MKATLLLLPCILLFAGAANAQAVAASKFENFSDTNKIVNAKSLKKVNLDAGKEYLVTRPMYVYSHTLFDGHNATIINTGNAGDIADAAMEWGTAHPATYVMLPYYACSNPVAGNNVISLKEAANGTNFKVGDVVVIRSNESYTEENKRRMNVYQFISVITAMSKPGTIQLQHPFTESFTGAEVANCTNTNVPSDNNNKFFINDSSVIKNVKLVSKNGYPFSRGGIVNGVFENIEASGNSVCATNTFAFSFLENIRGTGSVRLVEIANNSNNSVFQDFDLTFKKTDQAARPLVGLHENSYNNLLNRFTIHGAEYDTGPCVLFLDRCRNNIISNFKADVPNAQFDIVLLVSPLPLVHAETVVPPFENITLQNSEFHCGRSLYYLRLVNFNGKIQNFHFVNNKFYGQVSKFAAKIEGKNHLISNNYFEYGSMFLGKDVTGCKIINNYIKDGFSGPQWDDGSAFKKNTISGNKSEASELLDSVSLVSNSAVYVEGATNLKNVYEVSIPGILQKSDKIDLNLSGMLSGGGAKNIRIMVNNTVVSNFVSQGNGAWSISGELALLDNSISSIINSSAANNSKNYKTSVNYVQGTPVIIKVMAATNNQQAKIEFSKAFIIARKLGFASKWDTAKQAVN